MISILQSSATAPSREFRPQARRGRENNISWLERLLKEEMGAYKGGDYAYILLLGGNSSIDFRLRVAQSQLRHDLAPSHWSHALLLGAWESDLARTAVYEISLQPNGGFGFPPPTNGVQEERLGVYRSSRSYPNIGLLSITAPPEVRVDPEKDFQQQVMDALDRFKGQRAVLDALDLTLKWLSYVWGTGHSDNPLLDGVGIPAAAMLEMVFGAVGFDLTPGLESRASCPEAIWQAAKWWYQYYERKGQESCQGAYYIGHRL
jgi:hypothetical protein